MKIAVTLTERDLRRLAYDKLKDTLPAAALENWGANSFEVKTTYRANENWRRPRYIQMHFEREITL